MGSNRHLDLPVQVRVDGTWYDGWLERDDWRRNGDRWEAMIRWQTGPADNRMQVFDQDDIRPAADP